MEIWSKGLTPLTIFSVLNGWCYSFISRPVCYPPIERPYICHIQYFICYTFVHFLFFKKREGFPMIYCYLGSYKPYLIGKVVYYMTNIIKKINGWQYIFLYYFHLFDLYIESVIRTKIQTKKKNGAQNRLWFVTCNVCKGKKIPQIY